MKEKVTSVSIDFDRLEEWRELYAEVENQIRAKYKKKLDEAGIVALTLIAVDTGCAYFHTDSGKLNDMHLRSKKTV